MNSSSLLTTYNIYLNIKSYGVEVGKDGENEDSYNSINNKNKVKKSYAYFNISYNTQSATKTNDHPRDLLPFRGELQTRS